MKSLLKYRNIFGTECGTCKNYRWQRLGRYRHLCGNNAITHQLDYIEGAEECSKGFGHPRYKKKNYVKIY